MLRNVWLVAMLLAGAGLCWWVYLAHYRAPEGLAAHLPDGGGESHEVHEFAHGIQEQNLPVPSALWVFFLVMFLFATGYVLWMRFKVGSY